jgi:hypothetical protein
MPELRGAEFYGKRGELQMLAQVVEGRKYQRQCLDTWAARVMTVWNRQNIFEAEFLQLVLG